MVSQWHVNGDINNYLKTRRDEPPVEVVKLQLVRRQLLGNKFGVSDATQVDAGDGWPHVLYVRMMMAL